MILSTLLATELPAVSPFPSPEAMLLTSVTVACLGLVIMLLSRPHTPELETENRMPMNEEFPAESSEPALADLPQAHGPQRAIVLTLEDEPPQPVTCAAPVSTELTAAAETPSGHSEVAHADYLHSPHDPGRSGGQMLATRAADIRPAAPQTLPPARGASALIAKAAQLLPEVFTPPAREAARPRIARRPAGFQPGARFSRSQQAFLRIPVVIKGSDGSGAEFREESCTLILLPQGAVIPMKQRVRPGDRLDLFYESRQQQVPCKVFGSLQGQDGKMLVEIEFAEPQKNLWPVSFPAWAGNAPASAAGGHPEREASPAHTPGLDSSGS